jgi:hypothetical protein
MSLQIRLCTNKKKGVFYRHYSRTELSWICGVVCKNAIVTFDNDSQKAQKAAARSTNLQAARHHASPPLVAGQAGTWVVLNLTCLVFPTATTILL